MKIERTFKAPIDEATARDRIKTYFAQAGYQKVSEKGIGLSFRRGSKTGSWLAINPSQVLAVADVQIKPKSDQVEVRADFEIKTVVRDETHFIEKFWNQEMQELETALAKGEYSSLRSKNLTAKALLAMVRSLASPLAYALIWGAIALAITFLVMQVPGFSNTYPEIIALFAMAIAAVVTYIISRYWKRRRQRR